MDLKREVDMEIYTGLKKSMLQRKSDTSSAMTTDLEFGTV